MLKITLILSCLFTLIFFVMQAYNEKIPVCNKAEDKKRYFKNVKTEFAGVHLAFGHFKTFEEISLNCSSKYRIYEYKQNQSIVNIIFFPKTPLLLEASFSDFLLNSFYTNDLLLFDETDIILQNIIGVENDLFIPNRNMMNPRLVVAFSKFDFFNYKIKINQSGCNALYGVNTFFKQFTDVMLSKVKYPDFWCPNIFEETSVIKLTLNDISNSFLIKNR
jgi:hypothetical protein